MENTRHKYEYQVDVDARTAAARVIRMVGQNKKVLELGAGPGSITRLLKAVGNCRITALEIDREAIKKLAPYCESVYPANLNDEDWPQVLQSEGKFEVIVAADVLEHVYDPLKVLSRMKDLLSDGGNIVVSLPHVGHSALHACLFNEDFEYQDWGLLDRTHIRFFGIKNIQELFENSGLKIIHAEFVLLKPEETEFASQWRKTSPEFRHELKKNPFGIVYQVVLKAVPRSADGDAISLMSLPILSTKNSFKDKLKGLARGYLSPRALARFRDVAHKLGIK